MLDITGCAHLFGGEAALAADLARAARRAGLRRRRRDRRYARAPPRPPRVSRGAVRRSLESGAPAMLHSPAACRAPSRSRDRVGARPGRAEADRPDHGCAARPARRPLRRTLHPPARPGARRGGRGDRPAPARCRRSSPNAVSPNRSRSEEDIAATLASLAATLAETLESTRRRRPRLELAPLPRRRCGCAGSLSERSRPMRAPKLVADLFREKFAGPERGDRRRLRLRHGAALGAGRRASRSRPDRPHRRRGQARPTSTRLIDRIGARLGPERVKRIADARQPHPGAGGDPEGRCRCQRSDDRQQAVTPAVL